MNSTRNTKNNDKPAALRTQLSSASLYGRDGNNKKALPLRRGMSIKGRPPSLGGVAPDIFSFGIRWTSCIYSILIYCARRTQSWRGGAVMRVAVVCTCSSYHKIREVSSAVVGPQLTLPHHLTVTHERFTHTLEVARPAGVGASWKSAWGPHARCWMRSPQLHGSPRRT